MWRLKRWWYLSKLLTVTITILIFVTFFSCPLKPEKKLKLKFRSKFNHGSLQSVAWKALYDFNPIDNGPFFRGCSWILGTKKAPFPNICFTYPAVMTLGTVIPYPKKIQRIYKSCDTPLEFYWHQHFFTENQQILLYQKIQILIEFEHIISNSFNFFWVFKGFFNMVEILIMPAKLANCWSS